MKSLLHTDNLSVGYFSKYQKMSKILLANLHLSLQKGKLTALIGVNGSGKSTLLRTLAGLQKPLGGTVLLDNQSIFSYSQHEISQKISLVLTDKVEINLMTVKELVSFGRYPYTNWLGRLGKIDIESIEKAMEITQITDWANEKLNQLSDGQQQKVWIARALAQDTPLLFLDEPTAHLDIVNRLEIMLLLRKIAENQEKAILIASHDLTELLQIAHAIWLIDQSELIMGTPAKIIYEGKIESVFAKNNIIFDRENKNFKVNL
jgi:iron complex transport system ATP-binding protein